MDARNLTPEVDASMSNNPYQSPAPWQSNEPPRPPGGPSLSRDDLRQVAFFQKGVVGCIGVYMISVALSFAFPQEFRLLLLIPVVIVIVTGAVFVVLLALKVYPPAIGILLGLLTLIPCLGLISLVVVNGKATSILKQHGIEVGLFGAKTQI